MSETQVFIKNDQKGDSFRRIEYTTGGKIRIFRIEVSVPLDILAEGEEEFIDRDERMEAPFTVAELCALGWADPEEWGLGEISEEDIVHIGVRLDTASAYYRHGEFHVWNVLGPAECFDLICNGERDLAVKLHDVA